MIERIRDLTKAGKNFAFETTCAGRHHAQTLAACAAAGYRVHLIFLWFPSPDMAIQRVAQRVRQGGHDIPEAIVRRRYAAGIKNLVELYLPMADKALILDNTEGLVAHCGNMKPIAVKEEKAKLTVIETELWERFQQQGENHVLTR